MVDSENGTRNAESNATGIKIEHLIEINNEQASKYPRIYAITFSIVIPMLFLIVLCFLFGFGLASIEGPSELNENNQIFADIEERYHEVEDFLITIEDGYDRCITKYMNKESSEAPTDDLMTFVNSCTQDSKSEARGKVQDMKNEDLNDSDLNFNWMSCPTNEADNSYQNAVMHSYWLVSYNAWEETYIGEGKKKSDAREEALAQADGFTSCHVNAAGGAMFWFTLMTTIGYGNTVPITIEGRVLVYFMGFLSILLFSVLLGQAGSIFVTITDDCFERIGLKRLTHGVVAAFFWLCILLLWFFVIAAIAWNYADYFELSEGDNFNLDDAYWYAFVSVTTVGFGDYYLPQESSTARQMFTFPLLMLLGFLMMSSFLLKFSELFLAAMRSNSEKLDDKMKSIQTNRQKKYNYESSIYFDEELQIMRDRALVEEEKEEEVKMTSISNYRLCMTNDQDELIHDPENELGNDGVSFNSADYLGYHNKSGGDAKKNNIRDLNLSSEVSQLTRDKIKKIEDIIGQYDRGRDMKSLIVPNDLLHAAIHVTSLVSKKSKSTSHALGKHVVILSGFPCCVNETPPTDTDGPPGTLAIAKCMITLGFDSVMIVTDECNESVFQAAIGNNHNKDNFGNPILLEAFPSEKSINEKNYTRMQNIVDEKCDLLIACKRAGPDANGKCYTMRGIDMTGLIAPLQTLVEMVRTKNSNNDADVKFIAIGDSGNELGMGKVIEKIRENPKIPDDLIGADYLIAASVSNWGGYALAAACALVKSSDDDGVEANSDSSADGKRSLEHWVEACVPTAKHEIELLDRCVGEGCRDGVSGKMETTVDGMPLETSLKCLQSIKYACFGG